jgi:hypothetical protein
MKDLIRIWWARLLGSEAVVMQDWQGGILYSQAKRQDGTIDLKSWVFYWYRVGPLLLRADGTVSKLNGDAHFVERWLYLDRNLRVEQILRGCEGFEF